MHPSSQGSRQEVLHWSATFQPKDVCRGGCGSEGLVIHTALQPGSCARTCLARSRLSRMALVGPSPGCLQGTACMWAG